MRETLYSNEHKQNGLSDTTLNFILILEKDMFSESVVNAILGNIYLFIGVIVFFAFVSGCFCVKFKKFTFYGVASEGLGLALKVFSGSIQVYCK